MMHGIQATGYKAAATFLLFKQLADSYSIHQDARVFYYFKSPENRDIFAKFLTEAGIAYTYKIHKRKKHGHRKHASHRQG